MAQLFDKSYNNHTNRLNIVNTTEYINVYIKASFIYVIS